MRFLLACLLMSSPALAAQPLAPEDNALIEKLLDASNVALEAEAIKLGYSDPEGADGIDDLLSTFSVSLADSVRAAFSRNFDRDAIKTSISVLSDSTIQPLLDLQQKMGGDPRLMLAIAFNLEMLTRFPDRFSLADSMSVKRLIEARGDANHSRRDERGLSLRLVALDAEAVGEATALGMSVEQWFDDLEASEQSEHADLELLISRYVYADIPPETIDKLTHFYASPEGVYYLSTSYSGVSAAMVPIHDRIVEAHSAAYSAPNSSSVGTSGDDPTAQDD